MLYLVLSQQNKDNKNMQVQDWKDNSGLFVVSLLDCGKKTRKI